MAGQHIKVVFVSIKCQNETMQKMLCHCWGSVSANSFHQVAAPRGAFFLQDSEFGNLYLPLNAQNA